MHRCASDNLALKNIEPLLSSMYAADIKGGRPSIAPDIFRKLEPLSISAAC